MNRQIIRIVFEADNNFSIQSASVRDNFGAALSSQRSVGKQEILPPNNEEFNAVFGLVITQFQPPAFQAADIESGSTVVYGGGGRTQTQTPNGFVVFTVISAAAYTITATTGEETTSGTVEITAMSPPGSYVTVRTGRQNLTAILTVLSCARYIMRRRDGLPRP